MDKAQFRTFKNAARNMPQPWVLDPVLKANQGTLLFTKGLSQGLYCEFKADGTTSLGGYHNVIEHITDAQFIPYGTKKFATQQEALKKAIGAGLDWIKDFLDEGEEA